VFSSHPLLNWNLWIACGTCFEAGSVFVWTAAIGVNRRGDFFASALGLLGIIVWWTAVAIGVRWLARDDEALSHWPLSAVLAASPGGLPLLTIPDLNPSQLPVDAAIMIALLTHIALATSFAMRFGRVPLGVRWSPNGARLGGNSCKVWLRPPRRSRLSAIVWKQCRELASLILIGVIAVSAIVLVQIVLHPELYNRPHALADMLIGVTIGIGLLVALAAGVANFDRDLGPRINNFWRSRPISPDLWFWTKFLSGLAIVALVFNPSPLAAIWWSLSADPANHFRSGDLLTFFFLVAIYAAAVAAICLIRQTIYAAILGGGLISGLVVISMKWVYPEHMPLESVVMILSTITMLACTLVAWLAVRYDWGRKT
jgi:hypothetical protein